MSRYEFTCWIENSRFCNERTFSQLNPQVIIQTDTSLIWWGGVYNGAQTLEQWSEEERTLYRKVWQLLATKLALFSFIKWKRKKVTHFKIHNKAALTYLQKMRGTRNNLMIKLSKKICYNLLNNNAFSTEYSSTQGTMEETTLF